MRAFEELKKATDRVEAITKEYGSIHRAKAIPIERVTAIKSVSVSVGGYSSAEAKESAKALAEIAMQRLEVDAQRDGEIERDRVLARLAAELETLRAYIPGVAARASIEIGITARALAAEVKWQN